MEEVGFIYVGSREGRLGESEGGRRQDQVEIETVEIGDKMVTDDLFV